MRFQSDHSVNDVGASFFEASRLVEQDVVVRAANGGCGWGRRGEEQPRGQAGGHEDCKRPEGDHRIEKLYPSHATRQHDPAC